MNISDARFQVIVGVILTVLGMAGLADVIPGFGMVGWMEWWMYTGFFLLGTLVALLGLTRLE